MCHLPPVCFDQPAKLMLLDKYWSHEHIVCHHAPQYSRLAVISYLICSSRWFRGHVIRWWSLNRWFKWLRWCWCLYVIKVERYDFSKFRKLFFTRTKLVLYENPTKNRSEFRPNHPALIHSISARVDVRTHPRGQIDRNRPLQRGTTLGLVGWGHLYGAIVTLKSPRIP